MPLVTLRGWKLHVVDERVADYAVARDGSRCVRVPSRCVWSLKTRASFTAARHPSGGDGLQIGTTKTETSRQNLDLLQQPRFNHSPEGRAADTQELRRRRHAHEQRALCHSEYFAGPPFQNPVDRSQLFRRGIQQFLQSLVSVHRPTIWFTSRFATATTLSLDGCMPQCEVSCAIVSATPISRMTFWPSTRAR